MKRAALYARVSTFDRYPQTQVEDLRQVATERGFEIVEEYVDCGVTDTDVTWPARDRLMGDARRGRFQVILTWSFDRLTRSKHRFVQILDELNRLDRELVPFHSKSPDTLAALSEAKSNGVRMNESGYILHRGVRMIEGWPKKIQAAQNVSSYTLNGRPVPRVPYGGEHDD